MFTCTVYMHSVHVNNSKPIRLGLDKLTCTSFPFCARLVKTCNPRIDRPALSQMEREVSGHWSLPSSKVDCIYSMSIVIIGITLTSKEVFFSPCAHTHTRTRTRTRTHTRTPQTKYTSKQPHVNVLSRMCIASAQYPGNPEFSQELHFNLLSESLWYQGTRSLKIHFFPT